MKTLGRGSPKPQRDGYLEWFKAIPRMGPIPNAP